MKVILAVLVIVAALASTRGYAQNRVLYLDGVNDYLQIQRPVSDDFTLEVWINLQSVGVSDQARYCTPIFDNQYNHGNRDFTLQVDSLTPGLTIHNPWAVTSSVPLEVGIWTHLAAVRDTAAGESQIYINGQLAGTGSAGSGSLDHESTVWIGRNKRTAYLGNEIYLHAYIDECRFWNRALTQTEIQNNLFKVLSGSEDGLVTYLNFNDDNFDDKTQSANHAMAYGSPSIIETNHFDSDLVITAATVGSVLGVEFETLPGQWYRLEYNTDLTSTNWTNARLHILGDGGYRWFFDPAGFTPMKFYRVSEDNERMIDGGVIAIPKTGQTTKFADGDDGDLQMGVAWPDPRFTDHGDGTVTDNLTGLIWLKHANPFGFRTWADALADCAGLKSGEHGLSDGSVAGDWRLPNVRELHSLIDYGRINPPLPAGHPFVSRPSNRDAMYWSSTRVPGYTMAYYVDIGNSDGNIRNDHMTETYVVWPVR